MGVVGIAGFFLLSFIVKILTGEENIVYYHYEIFIVTLNCIVLKILNLPVLLYLDILILGIGLFWRLAESDAFPLDAAMAGQTS